VLVGALGLASIVLIAVGVVQTLLMMRRPALTRLEIYVERKSALERVVPLPEQDRPQQGVRRRRRRRQTLFPLIARLFSRFRLMNWLEEQIRRAHINWFPSEIIAATLGGSAFLFLFVLVATRGNFPLAFFSIFLPPVVALWLLRVAQSRWMRRFEEQFADALMLMANTLRGGFSLLQAFETAARESLPPISDEFGRIVNEIQMGLEVEEALRNFARRVPTQDVEIFVTAVLIQREVGGNLAEVLDTLARMISERQRVQMEVRALSAQGRFSGMFLALLPAGAAMAIQVIGRFFGLSFSYIRPDGTTIPDVSYFYPLFHDRLGQIILGVSALLYAMGFLTINRITKVEV